MENKELEFLVATLNIESLDDLILKDEHVLIEVVNKSKSGLILPDPSTSSLSGTPMIEWVVCAVGNENCPYKVGSKIVAVENDHQLAFYRFKENNYILTTKYNIKLGVKVRNNEA